MTDYVIGRQTVSAPELLTPRTRMRGHRPGDFEAMVGIWGDEDVVRYILGRPSTEAETWARLLRYVGHWQALGFGYWAVEDRLTGEFLGEAGFADYKRDIEPSLGATPEAGWLLAPHAQGRGLATEVMRAALLWADANFMSDSTVCIFDPDHARSARVAEKCGYVRSHLASFMGGPTLVMTRSRHG